MNWGRWNKCRAIQIWRSIEDKVTASTKTNMETRKKAPGLGKWSDDTLAQKGGQNDV